MCLGHVDYRRWEKLRAQLECGFLGRAWPCSRCMSVFFGRASLLMPIFCVELSPRRRKQLTWVKHTLKESVDYPFYLQFKTKRWVLFGDVLVRPSSMARVLIEGWRQPIRDKLTALFWPFWVQEWWHCHLQSWSLHHQEAFRNFSLCSNLVSNYVL